MTAPAVHAARAIAALALGVAALACGGTGRRAPALTVTREDGRVVPLDSTTTEFTVGGVRVIHRANFATDVVAANLYLLGGTRQLTPATQGVEALLLQAAEYGSGGYPAGASRAAWGATGSALEIDPGADWTRYGFRGVRSEFDSTWNVFADRVTRPTLATRDVDVARARLVARWRQMRASPDGIAFLLADSVAYAGHPYALRPAGTEASLTALDSAALARYHAEQVVTSRMLLVVVGGVDRATVEAAVARTLARLPRGAYAWTLPPAVPRARADTGASVVTYLPRPAATNYVLGVFHGPAASDPEARAFRLATAMLSSQMNHAVRETRGLSYAAYAPYYDRGVTAAGVYVSTTAPARTLALVRAQLDTLRNESFLIGRMQWFSKQWAVEYVASNVTSADQAEVLARAQLYFGDWRRAWPELDAMRQVAGSAVHAAARKYLSRARFVYVGDTARAPRDAFRGF